MSPTPTSREFARHAFTQDLTWHLDDSLLCGRGDFFEETARRKTAENTAKHRDGGVGSVVANHHGGGKSSVVVTTLKLFT